MTSALAPLLPRQKEGDAPPATPGRAPPASPSLEVLRHDPGRYIVVLKPADVRMDGDFTHTLEKLILAYVASTGFDTRAPGFAPRFVQRLDYATSGVLVVALSRPAAAVAAAQLERRIVRKAYVALLHGRLRPPEPPAPLVFDAPIAEAAPGGFHMATGAPGAPGRPSRTECVPLAYGVYRGAPVTKVRLLACTGRRHQLRVHCAAAGFPIVGDATYVADDAAFFAPGFVPPRMMLHAKELRIRLLEPAERLYGWKSALRTAKEVAFDGGDPFGDALEGLVLDEVLEAA